MTVVMMHGEAYLAVRASWPSPSALNCYPWNFVTLMHAAEAVPSTPHSCLVGLITFASGGLSTSGHSCLGGLSTYALLTPRSSHHPSPDRVQAHVLHVYINNNNKRPLTPKSMPPAGDEHAKLKT